MTSAVRTRIGTSVPAAACRRCRASSSGLNGPGGSGERVRRLVARERVQAVALEHALGFVGEQHRVAVERNPHLLVPSGSLRRLGDHAGGREPCIERAHYVLLIGGQKQVCPERIQIAVRAAAW